MSIYNELMAFVVAFERDLMLQTKGKCTNVTLDTAPLKIRLTDLEQLARSISGPRLSPIDLYPLPVTPGWNPSRLSVLDAEDLRAAASLINSGMTWSSTREGSSFWSRVSSRLEEMATHAISQRS